MSKSAKAIVEPSPLFIGTANTSVGVNWDFQRTAVEREEHLARVQIQHAANNISEFDKRPKALLRAAVLHDGQLACRINSQTVR